MQQVFSTNGKEVYFELERDDGQESVLSVWMVNGEDCLRLSVSLVAADGIDYPMLTFSTPKVAERPLSLDYIGRASSLKIVPFGLALLQDGHNVVVDSIEIGVDGKRFVLQYDESSSNMEALQLQLIA